LTRPELTYLEYVFDTDQAGPVLQTVRHRLLEHVKKSNQPLADLGGADEESKLAEPSTRKPDEATVFTKDRRRKQVYAQVTGLKR